MSDEARGAPHTKTGIVHADPRLAWLQMIVGPAVYLLCWDEFGAEGGMRRRHHVGVVGDRPPTLPRLVTGARLVRTWTVGSVDEAREKARALRGGSNSLARACPGCRALAKGRKERGE